MSASTSLTLFTPAGVVAKAAPLKLAAKRLQALGFGVEVDESALAKHQRFGGDDATRLAALHRVALESPSVALATRGGYGLTRILDHIDWKLVARSIERGTRWVGHSDLTALQLGLLAHRKSSDGLVTWAGPLACEDFGRAEDAGGVDEVTRDCFVEAMSGVLEAVGFRTEIGFDGLGVKGTLWGGNMCMLNSLLGTTHMPHVKRGVLFLEDVNEHPYRVERNLLQLHQCGVLDAQKAIVLGEFSAWRKSPLDRGFSLKTVVQYLRTVTKTPIVTGLPFGHVPTKVSLPVGAQARLLVQGRDVLIGWEHRRAGGHAHRHVHDHVDHAGDEEPDH
jgi:muramoyltetrapeptide carboxypeptidase